MGVVACGEEEIRKTVIKKHTGASAGDTGGCPCFIFIVCRRAGSGSTIIMETGLKMNNIG